MEIITKELKPAEIKRRSVCIPKDKQYLLPGIGKKLNIKDELTGSTHNAVVGSQYRIQIPSWYEEHPGVHPGDKITFHYDNGAVRIDVEPKRTINALNKFERRKGKLSIFEGKVLDLIIEAFAEIEKGGIPAKVTVNQNGINVELHFSD